LIIIKLGGSIITDKDNPFALRYNVVNNIAKDIHRFIDKTLKSIVVVLGGGSFGHYMVSKYVKEKGFIDRECASITTNIMNKLALMVADIFFQNNLHAIVFNSHAIFQYVNQELTCSGIELIKEYLRKGIIPILYGDVILHEKEFKVLSGDEISWFLAHKLNAEKLIFVADVDGIYDKPPDNPNAKFLPIISLSRSLDRIHAETKEHDVTGGILEKLRIGLKYHKGFEVLIINGMKKENLYKALIGEEVKATRIIP